MFSMTNKNKL